MGGTLPPLSDAEQKLVARLEKGIGATDRSKLSQYLDAVRDVERRIQKIEEQAGRELVGSHPTSRLDPEWMPGRGPYRQRAARVGELDQRIVLRDYDAGDRFVRGLTGPDVAREHEVAGLEQLDRNEARGGEHRRAYAEALARIDARDGAHAVR